MALQVQARLNHLRCAAGCGYAGAGGRPPARQSQGGQRLPVICIDTNETRFLWVSRRVCRVSRRVTALVSPRRCDVTRRRDISRRNQGFRIVGVAQ